MMKIGQKLFILGNGSRDHDVKRSGQIVEIEGRYIVVQFKNYRESYLKVDVKHNIGRKFEIR